MPSFERRVTVGCSGRFVPINGAAPLKPSIQEEHEMRAEILELHNLYLERADMRVPLLANTERVWFDFIQEGRLSGDPCAAECFSKDGLALVLKYLVWRNAALRRRGLSPVSLRLANLIGDTTRFADWWAEADHERRMVERRRQMWKPTEREKVLAAWRKEDVQAQEPRRDAKQVLGPLIANLQQIQENAKRLT